MLQRIREEIRKYNNWPEKRRIWFEIILCFTAALLPKLYLSLNTLPVRTISDEIATLAAAAYYAGYDWSEVIQNAGYYGTGFFGLFFWLYKVIENPLIIYRIILVFCSIIQALTAVICYYFLRDIFQIKNSIFICVTSVLCSFCVATRTTIAYNEHPLILISWLYALAIALLIKNRDNFKKRFIFFVIAFFLIAYGTTIHIRFSIVAIATILVYIFYYIVFKEKLFPVKWVIIPGLLYMGAQFYITYIQGALWLVNKGETIRNSAIKVTTAADFHNFQTWKAWLSIIIGQLATMNVAMLGLFFFAVVMGFFFVFDILRHRVKEKRLNFSDNTKILIAVFLIFLLSAGGTIFAQSISWLNGVASGLINNEDAAGWYSYKAFTYVRYAAPYIGPVILCGFILCKERQKHILLAIKCSTAIFALFSLYFYFFILPLIQNNTDAVEAFIPWSFGWKYGDAVTSGNYIYSFLLCFILCLLGWLMFQNKKGIYFHCILCILLISQFLVIGESRDITLQKKRYSYIMDAMPTIENVLEENPDIDNIYVYDTSDASDHQIYYLWQFYLYDYKIIPELPACLENDTILITNGSLENIFRKDILEKNVYEIKINNNSYLYLGKSVYISAFEGKEIVSSSVGEKYLLTGNTSYKIDLEEIQNTGYYTVNFKITCSEEIQNQGITFLAETDSGNILDEVQLQNCEWNDDEGNVQVSLDIGFRNENINLVIFSEEIFDAEVEFVSLLYEGDTYVEGKDSFAELESVYEVLKRLGAEEAVFVSHDIESINENLLNRTFQEFTIKTKNYSDILNDNSPESFIIVKAEDDISAYQQLWNRYYVLSVNDKYYAAVSKAKDDVIEVWKSQGNSILANENGVSLKCMGYMEASLCHIGELNNLPSKDYRCMLEIEPENIEPGENITIIYSNGDKTEIASDNLMNGQYTFIIANGLEKENTIQIESSKNISIKDMWVKEVESGRIVEKFYKSILNREPDQRGYRDWVDWLDSGKITVSDLCRGLIWSDEFTLQNISDKNYVNLLYSICWGMENPNGNYDNYIETLENGGSRSEILEMFLTSGNCILK